MLTPRYDMNAEVRLPDGTPGRVVGIYYHAGSPKPQYLTERRDCAGVLYQAWFSDDDLNAV